MKVSIHQPEHLPWLGFYDKIDQCDMFILLDNVPFSKDYFQNRNKIRVSDGWSWLTVPVYTKGKYGQLINEVKIVNTQPWSRKCWKSIDAAYKRSPFWGEYSAFFKELYETRWVYLSDLNIKIIDFIISCFGIDVTIELASDLGVEGTKSDLILNICKKVGATEYFSGKYGESYLSESSFNLEGIKITYQQYSHPKYLQQYSPFIPNMSAIDLLFTYGPNSLSVIREHRSTAHAQDR